MKDFEDTEEEPDETQMKRDGGSGRRTGELSRAPALPPGPIHSSSGSGADLTREYRMTNMGKALSSDDFDLFPAGGGQISALIRETKPVSDIIAGMVS